MLLHHRYYVIKKTTIQHETLAIGRYTHFGGYNFGALVMDRCICQKFSIYVPPRCCAVWYVVALTC